MEFYNPLAYANAGQQFVGMARFCEVVIGAGRQPLHQLVLLSDARQDD
jgi:hypothetical protein